MLMFRRRPHPKHPRERYVDGVTLRLTRHAGHAAPAAGLESGWEFTVPVGGTIDADELLEELESVLDTEPFLLRQSWSHLSWGADTAWMEIVIGVSSGTAVAIINRLIEVVSKRGEKRSRRPQLSREQGVDDARAFVCKAREIPSDSVLVEEVEPLPGGGLRVVLRTKENEVYVVEMDNQGVYRLRRDSERGVAPTEDQLYPPVEFEEDEDENEDEDEDEDDGDE